MQVGHISHAYPYIDLLQHNILQLSAQQRRVHGIWMAVAVLLDNYHSFCSDHHLVAFGITSQIPRNPEKLGHCRRAGWEGRHKGWIWNSKCAVMESRDQAAYELNQLPISSSVGKSENNIDAIPVVCFHQSLSASPEIRSQVDLTCISWSWTQFLLITMQKSTFIWSTLNIVDWFYNVNWFFCGPRQHKCNHGVFLS